MKYPYWAYPVYRSLWVVLDLLYPPTCGGCGAPARRWCGSCQEAVQLITSTVCEKCGLPLENQVACSRCRTVLPHFHKLRSWSVFESPVKEALHRLKYRRDLGLGEAIANQMLDFVAILDWQIEEIIPIPLGKQRLKQRGYNQVAMIAFPLALMLGISYHPNALIRIRETKSQVGLNASQRSENMRNAFRADAAINGKRVLLVDDVATTGATLSSAAEALYQAGARRVYAVTVARALPVHGLIHV